MTTYAQLRIIIDALQLPLPDYVQQFRDLLDKEGELSDADQFAALTILIENSEAFKKEPSLKKVFTQLQDELPPLFHELYTLQKAGIIGTEPTALSRANISHLDIFCAVRDYPKPHYLKIALLELQQKHHLTPLYYEWVKASTDPYLLSIGITELLDNHLGNEENFSLILKHDKPNEAARSLSKLATAGLMTRENRELIAHSADLDFLAETLVRIHEHRSTFISERIATIAAHPIPIYFFDALVVLQEANSLNQANFDYLLTFEHAKHIEGLARALCILKEEALDDEESRLAIKSYPEDQADFAQAFVALHKASLLEQNRSLLTPTKQGLRIAWIISHLSKAGILTQAYLDEILAHSESYSVAIAYADLTKSGILTPENKMAVLHHPDPFYLGRLFVHLHKAGRLDSANREAVSHYPKLEQLENMARYLRKKNILDQQNLHALLHAQVLNIDEGLYALSKANILDDETRNLLVESSDPTDLAVIFCELNKAKLFTAENRDFFCKDRFCFTEAELLQSLGQYTLLNEQNLERIKSLADYGQNIYRLKEAVRTLAATGILNQSNFETLLHHVHDSDRLFFLYASIAGLLKKQNNFDKIMNYQGSCSSLRAACSQLYDVKLLSQENFDAILANEHLLNFVAFAKSGYLIYFNKYRDFLLEATEPEQLIELFAILERYNLATAENCSALQQKPVRTAFIIYYNHCSKHSEHTINQYHFNIISTHKNPLEAARAMCDLIDANHLNPITKTAIQECEFPAALVRPLCILGDGEALTQTNVDRVLSHAKPAKIAQALCQLEKDGIASNDNKELLAQHKKPMLMAQALKLLHSAEMLSPMVRELLVKVTNPLNLAQLMVCLPPAHITVTTTLCDQLALHSELLCQGALLTEYREMAPKQFARLLPKLLNFCASWEGDARFALKELRDIIDSVAKLSAILLPVSGFFAPEVTLTTGMHDTVNCKTFSYSSE